MSDERNSQRARGPLFFFLGAVLFVAVTVGGGLLFWGALPTQSILHPHTTVMVQTGRVNLPGQDSPLGKATSVPEGSVLQLEEGALLHLCLFEGSLAEVSGPATIELRRVEQVVDRHALLSSYFASGPAGVDSGRSVAHIELNLVDGTIFLQAADTSSIQLSTRGGAAKLPGGGRVLLSAGDEQVWEAHAKEILVTSTLPPEKGPDLALYSLAPGLQLKSKSIEPASQERLEEIANGAALTETKEFEVLGTKFYRVPMDDVKAYSTVEKVDRTLIVVPTTIEVRSKIIVPGTRFQNVGSQDLRAALPKDLDWEVEILSGNRLRVKSDGVDYDVGVSTTGGEIRLSGLPLGMDVSQYLHNVPQVLSVETADNQATLTLPDKDNVNTRVAKISKTEFRRSGRLPSLPLFSSIPLPRDVSTDWNVLGLNLILAAWLAYAVRMFFFFANTFLETYGGTFIAALLGQRLSDNHQEKASRAWSGAIQFPGVTLLIMGAGGLLFSYLDPTFEIMGPGWVLTLVSVTLAIGVVGLLDQVICSFFLRYWGVGPGMVMYPGKLVLAALSVGASRVLAISPGLIFGTPGGLAFPSTLEQKRRSTLSIVSLGTIILLALFAWAMAMVIASYGSQPQNTVVSFAGPLARAQDLFLLVFAAAIMRLFSMMSPSGGSPGAIFWRRSRILWFVLYLPTGFVLMHVLLNRRGSFESVLGENLSTVIIVTVVSIAVGVLFKVISKKKGDTHRLGQEGRNVERSDFTSDL